MPTNDLEQGRDFEGVAIIGMSGRFPNADSVNQFWNNLNEGRDCISTISIDEAKSAGISDTIIQNPRYIRRVGRINNPGHFDASFFGYTPREASLIDPQQRLFLQCGYEAIENAGYNAYLLDQYETKVGVFAGCGMNHYLLNNIIANPNAISNTSEIQMLIGSDKDFLTTRLSYKLNFRGPSFCIQTACSTSLVAVHTACLNLLTHQCDVALAGGVFLQIPWWNGYLLTDGDIRSPDGVCRPFDANANGTIFGEGAGVVVLKRLKDAIDANDHIYAVIKGSAINNDGSAKAGYTAPSVDGQVDAIINAMAAAQVDPSEITYVEAHGTGTPLGDPVEFAALTKAFQQQSNNKNYCAIGSVKASIGHLDAAAGVASLIKTSLALYHKQIPASLNFSKPNPLLDIDNSPFYVANKSIPWNIPLNSRRRAGVNSLGVGGSNAHLILEEAPERKNYSSQRKLHILPFSTKSPDTLKKSAVNLAQHFSNVPESVLADVAHTLQNSRQHFPYKQFAIAKTTAEAAAVLTTIASKEITFQKSKSNSPKIVFMFSGQGSQYLNMGHELYLENNSFKSTFDKCSTVLKKYTGIDFRSLLFSNDDQNSNLLLQTNITQPLLFSFEFALAEMWKSYGVVPSAMIGHSIGEYVAACQSGVFTLEEALFLVAERGKIMYAQPPGRMLSVSLSVQEVLPLIDHNLEIALINSPSLCVVAGQQEHIDIFQTKLSGMNIDCRPIHTSHAFHSSLMNGAITPFTDLFTSVSLKEHSKPFISNVSGTWIQPEEVKDPAYWGRHLRNSVNFSGGVTRLLDDGYRVFLEIGPGNTLATFVNRTASQWGSNNKEFADEKISTITSIRHSKLQTDDVGHFLNSIGQLWQNGVTIDWSKLYSNENRSRVPLPTYPFEEKRHWIEPVTRPFYGMGIQLQPQTESATTAPMDITTDSDAALIQHKKNKISASAGSPDTELVVTVIWQELLGIESIDPSSSFFELGGDSIWAAQMLARIREKTGVEITIGTLYKFPSIEKLMTVIETAQKTTLPSKRSVPIRSDRTTGLNPSSSQQRLWFLHQLDPESPAFNLATEFEITGNFNCEIAQKAIDAVINRQDALRTTFIQSENGPNIKIHQKIDYPFEIIDLSRKEPADEPMWTNEIILRSIKQYDLQKGPLLRILVIRLSENRHILAVMTHHLVSDGWSMGVFLRDFTHFYESFANNRLSSLPELVYRFADYAQWQTEQSSTINSTNLEYWKKTLSGSLPILELPSDNSRPPALSYAGSSVRFSLSSETSKKLEVLTRKEQTTLFSVLLGTFYVLLSRYSGQSDIIIGAPLANRTDVEVEMLIGFFLNMLPLRIQIEKDRTFRQLLQHIKDVISEAFAHQEIPFNALVEAIKPQRDLNHPPIFQVMFAYQNFPIEPVTIGNTRIKPILVDRGATEFDVSLYMWPVDNVLTGNFEYSTELFDRSVIDRLASHFVNIADAIANTIDTPINGIKLLSDSEYHLINNTWNNTLSSFPEDKCVHDLFSEVAQSSPLATAVVYKNIPYSYETLDKASDQIAQLLLQNGVQPVDLVGICLERHFGMVAALLGILKTGATYVPLDPNYPQERLNYMVEDAQLKLIITEKNIRDKIPQVASVSVIELEQDMQNLQVNIKGEKKVQVSPENTAYIIYTSGSTGKPKGVRIPHRAVVNFLTTMQKKPGIMASDAVLAVTTLSFDIAVLEILLPLTTGASCIIVEHEITRDGSKLIDLINESKPTIMQGTPSMWRMLIASGWKGNLNLKALCGGEPLPYDLIRDVLPKVKELWNMYGPTEATVWATCYRITDPQASVLIGHPIANTVTYILDSAMQTVPIGVSGELFIGGICLAEGYHNKQDLTNEKFIANPFSKGRMYRTGDLARYRQDGAIEFMGRIDSQVKIRGFRIELGEIENVTLTHPEIRQCAASCKELTPGDLRLLLYYSLKSGGSITTAELRKHLRTFLPEYMVPQHYIEMDLMPLTPAGKIDHKSLPSPFQTEEQKKPDQQEPQTTGAIYLAKIWKKVLCIDTVHAGDNFFDLGGHSLLSVKVITQIKNDIGVDIHPKSMMLNTLEQIAANYPLGESTSSKEEMHVEKKASFLKKIGFFLKFKK